MDQKTITDLWAKAQAPLKDAIRELAAEQLVPDFTAFLAGKVTDDLDPKAIRKLALQFISLATDELLRDVDLPMRVDVFSGDQKTALGLGTYTSNVTVWVRRNEDGSLSSRDDAEQEPDEPGWELVGDNPKIVLDSGETVYGCQVWWNPVQEVPKSKRKRAKPSKN